LQDRTGRCSTRGVQHRRDLALKHKYTSKVFATTSTRIQGVSPCFDRDCTGRLQGLNALHGAGVGYFGHRSGGVVCAVAVGLVVVCAVAVGRVIAVIPIGFHSTQSTAGWAIRVSVTLKAFQIPSTLVVIITIAVACRAWGCFGAIAVTFLRREDCSNDRVRPTRRKLGASVRTVCRGGVASQVAPVPSPRRVQRMGVRCICKAVGDVPGCPPVCQKKWMYCTGMNMQT
jgi:hypothetical protein